MRDVHMTELLEMTYMHKHSESAIKNVRMFFNQREAMFKGGGGWPVDGTVRVIQFMTTVHIM